MEAAIVPTTGFLRYVTAFEAYLDKETLQPVWHLRNTSEGNFNTYEEYHFDYGKNLIYSATQNTKKPYKKDTLKIEHCTFDLLSLAYFARNFDFSQTVCRTKNSGYLIA